MNRTQTRCRSCGAEIFWATTREGKRIPIDDEEIPDGNVNIELVDGVLVATVVGSGAGSYVSHFATCTFSSVHRKRGASGACEDGPWVVP